MLNVFQRTDAGNMIESKIRSLRNECPKKIFDKGRPAEVEVNKFFFNGEIVDRIMIVLRSNGCEHYKKTGGCAMCSHSNGAVFYEMVAEEDYKKQWNSILDTSCLEKPIENFSLDNFSIVCVYNLGSFLNENEISLNAIQYIFASLNKFRNVKKVIIESRPEYITRKSLNIIKNTFDGLLEVGIGVESTNRVVREL